MGRLKNLAPQVGGLASRLGRLTDEQGHSPVSEPWRAWYHLARWKHPKTGVRMRVFLRDGFKCQMCGRINGNTRELSCDHVEPHKGDEALFWAETNLQTLCTDPCHNTHKQRLERGAGRR